MAKRYLHSIAGQSYVRAYSRRPLEGRMYFLSDVNEVIGSECARCP